MSVSHSVDQPGVGVAVLIRHNNQLLISRRPNFPEQNHWQCAGGYLQVGEDVFDCAYRCATATGVQIARLQAGPYTNNLFSEQAQHTVTLYVLAQYLSGFPLDGWHWYDWQQLPQPMFLPLKLMIEQNHDWLAERMDYASDR